MKPNSLICGVLILTAFLIFALTGFGQQQPVPAQNSQTTVNEDFELNITQDRITENNFERSTQVELTDSSRGGLRIAVGVGASAERIDVLLRGIFGRVRFRASLEQIKSRLERLNPAQPAAPK